MFYRFMRGLVRVILAVINGNARYENKEVLPQDENYILVAPHRTWWAKVKSSFIPIEY